MKSQIQQTYARTTSSGAGGAQPLFFGANKHDYSRQRPLQPDPPHMPITLYTNPGNAECALTKAALVERGIEFTERSATEYAHALTAKGFVNRPVLTVAVENELVAWQGHRPDLIELLADLIDLGPVSVGGLREIDEADVAVVTRAQVMDEIRRHHVNTEEFFAEHGNHPLYRGAVLLGWLGY